MVDKIFCLVQDHIEKEHGTDTSDPSFILLRLRINVVISEKIDEIIEGEDEVNINELKSKLI